MLKLKKMVHQSLELKILPKFKHKAIKLSKTVRILSCNNDNLLNF